MREKGDTYRIDSSTIVSIGPERAVGFCGAAGPFMEKSIVIKGDGVTENLASLSEAPCDVRQRIEPLLERKSPLL